MLDGVDFLQNESLVIKDTLFIGATLWTDFNFSHNKILSMFNAQYKMNDYLLISGKNGKITSDEILAEHLLSKSFIEHELKNTNLKTCVVTHHAPYWDGILSDQEEHYCDYYTSNLRRLIIDHKPNLWLHGHMHSPVDYMIADTRIKSNPRGRGNDNPLFNILNTTEL